jgi:hypothetical protein
VLVDRLDMTPEEFHRITGWEVTPDGACRGDVCVPLRDGDFDALAVVDQLGMAVVHDAELGLSAIGPETLGGRSLTTTDASDFSLPDLDGNLFRLSSLQGEKVLLVAWAPY